MSNRFCDSELTTGNNDGTTFDDAWRDVRFAFQSGLMNDDVILWIRRRSSFVASSADIRPVGDGIPSAPISAIGCPRNILTGTITFTNGSNVISASSITPDFEKHLTRRIKNDADGAFYMMTALAHKIDYDNKSGVFTEDLMVTGGTSGAVGKIHKNVDNGATGSLWIVVRSGTFQDGEQITDEDTGIADIDGAPADDGFVIDKEYAGSTAVGGAFTIEKDEDYDLFMAIDDSGWTIKKADWNADPQDLSIIDFNSLAYQLQLSSDYCWVIKNLIWKDSQDTSGAVYIYSCWYTLFKNCIFLHGFNCELIRINDMAGSVVFSRCLFIGNAIGNTQNGIEMTGFSINLRDCAIYNFGNNAIKIWQANVFFDNINMGIELPNENYDVGFNTQHVFQAKDLKMGGKNGLMMPSITTIGFETYIEVENYGKIRDAHKFFCHQGEVTKRNVVEGSGDPYKRSGGADSVIDIICNVAAIRAPVVREWKHLIFEHEFEMGVSSKSYRYYVQCKDMAITDAGQLYIELEYVDKYDDDTEYHLERVRSDEVCSQRSGADDWSQYIEVTGIQPAVTSKVRIKCLLGHYDADGHIFVDPKAAIT